MTEPIAREAKESKPVTAKATPAGTVFEETIRVETDTFDPTQEHMIKDAEMQFRARIAEAYGKDIKLKNVECVAVNHHIGTAAFYKYRAVAA
jgi:hypothetical protein